MNEEKPLSNNHLKQKNHFFNKEMIKMDIEKPAGKPTRKMNLIRLSLDDDMYLPPEGPSKKHQAFLKIASSQMLKMDTKRKDFLQKAANEMVKDVLQQEFGKAFMDDKGFAHMQETITNTLLHSPKYREILQKLLGLMNDIQSDSQ